MKHLMGVFILIILVSCDLFEREQSKEDLNKRFISDTTKRSFKDTISVASAVDSIMLDTLPNKTKVNQKDTLMTILDVEKEIQYVDELRLQDGLKINWIERKRGRKLRDGELIQIEYRLGLPDGKIIDGNNKMNKPFLPFIIGYNMQQKGWDLALSEMCVGDVAKIEIPASLAYGKNGLGSIIPPNTDNWLFIKILGLTPPNYDEDGIRYWEYLPGDGPVLNNAKVKFHMVASTKSKANVFNTYYDRMPRSYVPGQKNVPKGLVEVLKKAKENQHVFVILSPEMAYGQKGYMDLVKPNESVFYNLKILESE